MSGDRHAALVQISVADADYAEGVIAAVERADAEPSFEVDVTGETTREHDFNQLSQDDLKSGELQFGLPAALIILLLVFGGVVAGLVPLLMAMSSIVVALGLTALVAQGFELSVFVVNMLTGMGLALGIDYALFVVSRYREERDHGREQFDAISASGVTASRAVLFSGTAFVIAMFGMLLVPSSIMRSLAVGAILVGAVSVAAALTLLPALLGLLGDRVDALRIPLIGRRPSQTGSREGRFWGAIVRRVLRRPALSLAVSVAGLLALAVPIFGMTPARAVSRRCRSASSRGRASPLWRATFPGDDEPTEIVVTEQAGQPAVRTALAGLRNTLADDPRFGAGTIERSADGETAVLTVPVQGDPSGEVAIDGVRDLRSEIVPAAFRDTDAEVLVGGLTAENIDYFGSVIDPAPFVIAFVLGLTFVLLTIVFRSVAIAGLSVAAQPAVGRRRVRAARARLPARHRCRSLRLPAGGVDRGLGAAVPVLGALRAVDGLPGLHAQPDQGALRGDGRHDRRNPVRRVLDGTDHHRRGADHRRRVRRLRARRPDHVPADGLRRRRRAADRRDGHSLRACYRAR